MATARPQIWEWEQPPGTRERPARARADRAPRDPRAGADHTARARAERRQRVRHLRRLRRDLLEDFGLGFLLMIFALVATAGLGVIALLEVPLAGAVIGSFVLERRLRRRRARTSPRGRSRRRPAPGSRAGC